MREGRLRPCDQLAQAPCPYRTPCHAATLSGAHAYPSDTRTTDPPVGLEQTVSLRIHLALKRKAREMSDGSQNRPEQLFTGQIAAGRVFTSLTFVAAAATAVGALAIGAVAIGALSLKRGKIESLSIDDLEVGRLRVRELILEDQE